MLFPSIFKLIFPPNFFFFVPKVYHQLIQIGRILFGIGSASSHNLWLLLNLFNLFLLFGFGCLFQNRSGNKPLFVWKDRFLRIMTLNWKNVFIRKKTVLVSKLNHWMLLSQTPFLDYFLQIYLQSLTVLFLLNILIFSFVTLVLCNFE